MAFGNPNPKSNGKCIFLFSLMANFSKVKDAFEFGLFLSLLK
jgi:hypothetical protein